MLKNPKYGWFNKTNAATYLGVSRPTLDQWIKNYKIPYSVIDGIKRFSKADLDDFMEEHKK
ncbi:MAG: helix-turn-helix domain-containing protein [Lactobacillus sp.]|nr:helix-turn-helix domain-containing protein [Lactobacillus sp.]